MLQALARFEETPHQLPDSLQIIQVGLVRCDPLDRQHCEPHVDIVHCCKPLNGVKLSSWPLLLNSRLHSPPQREIALCLWLEELVDFLIECQMCQQCGERCTSGSS